MKKIKLFYPFVLVLIVLFITIRSLSYAEFFRVHDFTQGARVAEMFRGFQDGQIPVRWSKNFGYGYGMPTFLFYSPLPYIFGAFFYWLSGSLVFSLRCIWAIPSILSFVGMYLYTRKNFGRLGALVAATAFTLAPYRAVDLYVRGAIGEIWGIAFFPWVLWSIDNWYTNKQKVDVNLIFLSTLLFLSHNLIAFFFFPVIFAYTFLKWLNHKNRSIADFIYSNLQIAIALACSTFYLLPAFLEKNVTKFDEKILGGYFHYSLHFLYLRQFFQENWKYGGSTWGPEDDLSFFLGYGQLLGGFIFMLLLTIYFVRMLHSNNFSLIKSFKKNNFVIHPLFPVLTLSLIFFPVSIFLAIQKSLKVWDAIQILQTAQFPWRFLSLSLFFIAIFVGLIFRFQLPSKVRITLGVIILLLLTVPAYKYFAPEKFVENSASFYYDDARRIRFEMSESWVDFLPLGFNEKLPPTDKRFHLSASGAEEDVEVLIDRSQQLLLKTHFTTPTAVTLHIGAFPGWKTYLQNNVVEYSMTKDGLIELIVPAGEQLVSANFERTPIRLIADLISVTALCGIILSKILVKKII